MNLTLIHSLHSVPALCAFKVLSVLSFSYNNCVKMKANVRIYMETFLLCINKMHKTILCYLFILFHSHQ